MSFSDLYDAPRFDKEMNAILAAVPTRMARSMLQNRLLCFLREGGDERVISVADVVVYSRRELLRVRRMGPTMVDALEDGLRARGHRLRPETAATMKSLQRVLVSARHLLAELERCEKDVTLDKLQAEIGLVLSHLQKKQKRGSKVK
jgi:hypothetical protein